MLAEDAGTLMLKLRTIVNTADGADLTGFLQYLRSRSSLNCLYSSTVIITIDIFQNFQITTDGPFPYWELCIERGMRNQRGNYIKRWQPVGKSDHVKFHRWILCTIYIYAYYTYYSYTPNRITLGRRGREYGISLITAFTILMVRSGNSTANIWLLTV